MSWTAADITMLRAVIRQAKQSLNDAKGQLEKVEKQAEKMLGEDWQVAEDPSQLSLPIADE